MKPNRQSNATILLAAIIGVAAAALPVRAVAADAESFQYAVENLPQDSDPRWELLGGDALRPTLDVVGTLEVESTSTTWGQWRIGRGPQNNDREFGDASALAIESGGAATVDFRVRLPDHSLSPDVPCFYVSLNNGKRALVITFFPGQVEMAGQAPFAVDTAEWGNYRIVIDGMRHAFYCAQTGTAIDTVGEVASDYGRFIGFGIPSHEGLGEPRGFELQVLRWYPNQALFSPPESSAP